MHSTVEEREREGFGYGFRFADEISDDGGGLRENRGGVYAF